MSVVVLSTTSSCDNLFNEVEKQPTTKVETIVQLPDTVKQRISAQDSCLKELVLKIETLVNETNEIKKKNEELQTKIDERNSETLGYVSIGAILLSCLAFVFAFIIFRKGIDEPQAKKLISKKLEESKRINGILLNIERLDSTINDIARQNRTDLPKKDSRIQAVERSVKGLKNNITDKSVTEINSSKNNCSASIQETIYKRYAYAKINSENFFMDVLDSKQEGCVYSLEFKNETEGEFSLISLDKIKSRNEWQKVIECSGACIEDANSFQVEKPGIFKKVKNGSAYEVIENLKIKLIK